MKYYMPCKPVKWGFKIHCVCESENGYCMKVELDQGIMKLKEIGIASTGTVKMNHNFDNEKENIPNSTTGSMNFIEFKDKRVMHCITTAFDDTMVTVNRKSGSTERPEAINEYARHMGGVDRLNKSMK